MSRTRTVTGSARKASGVAAHGVPPGGSIAADITAVFTLTVSSLGFSISLAVLIFSGPLESGMSRAIGSFVVGGALMAIVVGARSRIVPVATFVQDGPAIVMAAVAADFIARDGTKVADVFVLLLVTMLATSLATGLLGNFGLGELGRYAPASVVAAFLGGTGWLLLKGGIDVMTNTNLGLADLYQLSTAEMSKFWVPGLFIGVICWLAARSPHVAPPVVGLIISAALGGFYLVVGIASSVAQAESGGWLLGPFPDSGSIRLITPAELSGANWGAIAQSIPGIAGVVGLACVAQVVHLTGIKAEVSPGLDIDDELRTSAGASLLAAVVGVSPGFQGFGYTVLLDRLGATRRAVGVVAGGLVLAFGIVGIAAVGYVPRLVVGAMLIMIGLALLEDWLRGLIRSASVVERLLGPAIVFTIAWFGLLQGLGVGLIAACAIFIVRYSRVDPVRSVRNGRQIRSHVDRSPRELRLLRAGGDRLVVFELHGFLFFGSLTTLEDRVRDVASRSGQVQTLVLDFTNVTGIDGSGFAVIARLLHEFWSEGVEGWLAGLDPALRDALLAAEAELATHVVFLTSLDAAVERAEDRLLATTSVDAPLDTIARNISRSRGEMSPELLAECASCRLCAGTVVMHQGVPSNGLFIVHRGRLTERRLEADGTRTRLRRFGAFTVAGEVGHAIGEPRSTEVVAEGVVDGWFMSRQRYHELRKTNPWLILELHEFVLRVQAERMNALRDSLAGEKLYGLSPQCSGSGL